MAEQEFSLSINGSIRTFVADQEEPLLWILRDKLNLTSVKYGCGIGVCGACSVLIDGVSHHSCSIPVGSLSGSEEIVTVEGLFTRSKFTPVQKAFLEHNAFCCGFCTPGMIITATALINSNPTPTREEIIAAMDGNICRCGAYMNIIEAILSVAEANSAEVR